MQTQELNILWAKIFAVLIGSILLASGIDFFLVPFKIMDGGVIGIALICKYILGFHTGLTMLICSIPIYILAFFYNRNLFYSSIHGLLLSTLAIDMLFPYRVDLLPYVYLLPPWVSAIVGGIFVGTGIGIMLRNHTSTGGTDLLGQFISDWVKINVGFIIMIIDAVIIGIGGLLISAETMWLSFIAVITIGLATGVCTMKKKTART